RCAPFGGVRRDAGAGRLRDRPPRGSGTRGGSRRRGPAGGSGWRVRRGACRRRRSHRHGTRRRSPLSDERRGSRRARRARPFRRCDPREGLARRWDRARGGSIESGAGLMLYHLLYPFRSQLSVLNVIQYITFRTAAASLSALAISIVLGPWMIRKLRAFQIGQVIRAEGPQAHQLKAGTPTMGGLLILTASLVPT